MKTTLALCAAAVALVPSAVVGFVPATPIPGVSSSRAQWQQATTRMMAAPANEEGATVSRGGFLSTC